MGLNHDKLVDAEIKANRPRAKNECGKMRKADNPYEVWQAGTWTWYI